MQIDPWLERAASLRPDRLALEAPGVEWSYAELLERARAAAVGEPGQRVGLAMDSGPELVVALHACILRGAVAVPIDPRLAPPERAAQAATAAAVLVALPPSGRAPTRFAARAGDPLMVVHTSGTTGVPQPVELSYGNVLANALGSAVALGLDPAERWLCPLPLSHVGGLMVLLRSAIYATTVVLRALEGAELHGATLASLVPTQLARALDAGLERPPGLRAILLGGAGAPAPLLRRAAAAGVPVAQTYGLTQACSQVTVSEPGDLTSQGRPLPGTRVEIAPDGEILVSGPSVAGGGRLATGDLGRLDERGRLVVVGRRSDTIVTGGENVAPAEVEGVLLEHPAVADAGVFGRPDAEWGEAVTAQVVLRAPVGPEALRGFVRERLAAFKVPKAIEPVDALPRTFSGKLERYRRPMTDPTEYRTASRQRWGRSAQGWSARREQLARAAMPVSVRMIEAIAPQPGHALLELAAGIGDTGFLAAELVAPGGTLTCSDFSPEMLTGAQARAEELGLADVRFKQIDAESIDLDAGSVDGVLCRWGYMLMADPGAALRETRRVLRPGGRLALAAWTGPKDNPWMVLPRRALLDRGLAEPPDPEAPGPFSWADAADVEAMLAGAGFVEDVWMERVDFTQSFESFEEWWQTQLELSSAFAELVAPLDAATIESVQGDLRAAAAPFANAAGAYGFPAATWVAGATA